MDAEAELLTAEDLEDVKPIPGDEGWCHYCGFSWPTCFCARAKATIDALTTENATLKAALAQMEERKDGAYLERNKVVQALSKCFPSGVARTVIEGWSEDWHGCVYIDLPSGQVSWHFHDSQASLFDHLGPYWAEWDGHTTEEKYERLRVLAGKEDQG